MTSLTQGLKDWKNLDVGMVTKDIPPGWHGPGTERTFRQWKADLESWKRIASYDDDEGKIGAVEFRVPDDIKEKIRTFGRFPGVEAAAAAFEA